MKRQELLPHLFRTEFSKITSVLARRFGIGKIEIAEDIASETFLLAVETWPYKGLPENPTAWLYLVAKNKAKNYLHRRHIFDDKVAPQIKPAGAETVLPEIDLSDENITDSQLQMLFAICHPSISAGAQIGLALRILCGFGIDEIADAFLTNKETVNKRLFRAREKLREENAIIELPPESEIDNRLGTVLKTLYLLFNEGYYSESRDVILREDLCAEAMRLVELLINNPQTNRSRVNALYALMCFHASRFKARKSENGEFVLYADQDEGLWDQELTARGIYHLHLAAEGDDLSKYHLEAGIAYWHTIKTDTRDKWEHILQLHNQLLQVEYSPIAALNRTYALSKANGKTAAIAEALKLNLTKNHFYHTLLGVLYLGVDNKKAAESLSTALGLAKTATDKRTIQKKLDALFD